MSLWYTGNIVGSHPHGGDDPCCSGYEDNRQPPYIACCICHKEIAEDEETFNLTGYDGVFCKECFDSYEPDIMKIHYRLNKSKLDNQEKLIHQIKLALSRICSKYNREPINSEVHFYLLFDDILVDKFHVRITMQF